MNETSKQETIIRELRGYEKPHSEGALKQEAALMLEAQAARLQELEDCVRELSEFIHPFHRPTKMPITDIGPMIVRARALVPDTEE